MKPYFLGQGIFHFVDGLLTCPSPHVVATDDVSLWVNNSFVH